MDQDLSLAARFEADRTRLRSVAYRMLGSPAEAEDAVQEAWLRLSRAGSAGVENLSGWLTTVVARVCLDMLRSRKSRREDPLDVEGPEPADLEPADVEEGAGPEREALLADSIGVALLAVLETLAPAERVAFVLHEMFDLPFDEIAPIVGRSSAAARQLASRARRRVQGMTQGATHSSEVDLARKREVVDAFLAASRSGDLGALLALLDPGVVLRADRVAVETAEARRGQGALELSPEIRGAAAVARTFSGRAQAARPALFAGTVGAAWAPGGKPLAVFAFTVAGGTITGIDLIADPAHIDQLALTILDR
jgi:RNA polymerase sigma-70 factor (ECF subfamily)